MVSSPRKRAPPSTFNQTWDDTDATFLDPNTLPVARMPRGWERRQETKKTELGREKTIWRRFNLRSRAPSTIEHDEEEQHDARSRAVKKQQQMSPRAMEKTVSGRNGKNRAFKATRWDRRKSVLPRKKIENAFESGEVAQEAEEHDSDIQDATFGDESYESFTEVEANDEPVQPALNLIPTEDRRGTFTFTVASDSNDTISDDQCLIELETEHGHNTYDSVSTDDNTLAQLFRSPIKSDLETPTLVEYPQLPQNDEQEVLPENLREQSSVVVQQEDDIIMCQGEGIVELTAPIEAADQGADEQEVIDQNSRPGLVLGFNDAIGEDLNKTPVPETENLEYPVLPSEPEILGAVEVAATPFSDIIERTDEIPDASEDSLQMETRNIPGEDMDDELVADNELVADESMSGTDEEFTEASLQLDIQKQCEETGQEAPGIPTQASSNATPYSPDMPMDATLESLHFTEETEDSEARSSPMSEQPSPAHVEDITDGLTLAFTPVERRSAEPTPRKLHSPPPPPVTSGQDDVTMTIALDDDTALLKDFLNRAAASKAEKAAVLTHRRESLQNRRDSDVIRHALASPRKALGDKDPNSPSKYDAEMTLDLSQTLTLKPDTTVIEHITEGDSTTDEKSGRTSRRSSRTKKSRLPGPASATPAPTQAQASKIAIRRADGTEHVVLKKSDAQELATITRANTRKNKQGAFCVTVRLLKLAVDAAGLEPIDDSTKELVVGKNIRWDEQLAYYQENPETVAEAESLATPDELGMEDAASTAKAKSKISKNSTPKIRRVRGLGTANGTPGKGLLTPASLLPEAVQEEKEVAPAPQQQLPRPKVSKIKKMPVASTPADQPAKPASTTSKLPTLDVVPVGVEPTKERKSRLAAPRKVMLPQPTTSIASEGKENTQRAGISAATPKKGIPAPKVVAPKTIVPPSVGMESGLPRRRGRRV